MKRFTGLSALPVLVLLAAPSALCAQADNSVVIMAQAIGAVDHVDPTPGNHSLSEVRLVQPMATVIGTLFHRHLTITGSLDLEGATMPGGELAPGDWGEGFIDRRHPHTYAHELLATYATLLPRGAGQVAFSLGKGFAPFGTDDPMSRPFLRYPVNHHLSQILERAVAIAQYRVGPVTAEVSGFDGDEPTKPSDWPVLRTDEHTWRFGDSHSARLTLQPAHHLEVQGSFAHVHSPESRQGGALDANKQSASVRWQDETVSGERYAMVEWARSSEVAGFFVYHSVLAEAMMSRQHWRLSYRFENTERPEEVRLADRFRTLRPSPDNSILGISRWTLHTVHLAFDAMHTGSRFVAMPFVEVTLGAVAAVGGGVFNPAQVYGSDRVRTLSAGLRVDFGMQHHRMGRYGIALPMDRGMAGMSM